jgi:GGDEF domain-containing protein
MSTEGGNTARTARPQTSRGNHLFFGQAVFPDDADIADGLLRHADASMVEAKRSFITPG